jgi:hypothetical protein
MDKRTFLIGVLSLSAVILLAANLIQPRIAEASFVVKDNEYTAVTARISKGGEALYLLDNRSGRMAVLHYDNNKRAVLPLTQGTDLTLAFQVRGGPAPVRPGGR